MRLRVTHPKLARLHPAQIADLVEAASQREGEEIIEAVGSDEELDEQHQLEFIQDRSDEEVSAGVILSAIAVARGASGADPIIGLVITAPILRIT